MVELTHGGAWLKWSSLGRKDRNWALLSFATAFLAVIPIGLLGRDWHYRVGFWAGSGGQEAPARPPSELLASGLFDYAMLASAALAIVSVFAWWRFSRNQDEMFNRIQNFAIAQASGWTFAAAFIWWQLWLGDWVGPMSPTTLVLIGTVSLLAFWFYAVRRWL